MEELKTCRICMKEIQPNDNFCRLTDYFNGKFLEEHFYHTTCYNKKIKASEKELSVMKKLAVGTLLRANKVLNKQEKMMD